MLKTLIDKSVPHLTALLLFLIITLVYFSPILEGKRLEQSDITQFRGMAQEIVEYRKETGEEALWTNSMFSGMPAYLISVQYPFNLVRNIDQFLSLGLPQPAKYLFLSLTGFYILMLAFRVNPWLAIAGAIAFAFSTYFFIIEAVGHNTKAHAMSYMAPLLAGIVISFRGKLLLGCALTAIFLALQIYANHLQVTYYTLLIVLVFGAFELTHAIRKKLVPLFLKNLATLFIPVILAVGVNFANIYLVWEYGRYSMRGPSELTSNQDIRTGGLDKDYILDDYSYGITETMNLLIPNFKGGSSSHDLGTDSEVYRVLSQHNVPQARDIAENMPAYWGPQAFTAGPVYIGAAVIFFFVLGLFVLKGRYKWWLLSATLLSISLAWGKHFMFLSELFIDYFPGYDKFRTVSMILIIAQLTIPFLAIIGVREIIARGPSKDFIGALKKSFYIVGGVTLFFALMPGALLSFTGDVDQQLLAMGWPDFLIDALQKDRISMLRADAFRSFVFVSAGAGLMLLFLLNKIPAKYLALTVALLFLIDLWPVNRRFLDNDNFITPREITQPFLTTEADAVILRDDDPHYRVFNRARNTFNEAITSYHHKSIGGYHGAKMGRYQDLIDHHLRHNNMDVLNMLNARYFIHPGDDGQPQPFRNPNALGNAWFVDSLLFVDNADQEIEALNDFDPAVTAIVDRRFEEIAGNFQSVSGAGEVEGADTDAVPDLQEIVELDADYVPDQVNDHQPDDYIELISYSPNHLVYRSDIRDERVAVFSEVHYDAGWRAYINNQPAEHFRVNYILRAMIVPPGDNEIEFRFRPWGYFGGRWINLASSVALILLSGGIIWHELKREAVYKDELSGVSVKERQ